MAAFNLDDESLDERRPKALRTVARTLDELAELAEGGLPEADQTTPADAPHNIDGAETQFAETWRDIKACVQTHLQTSALNESLDRDPFAVVSIDGHPPANKAMTLSVRYGQEGALKIDISNP